MSRRLVVRSGRLPCLRTLQTLVSSTLRFAAMGTLPYTDALAYYDRDIDTKQGVRAAVEQEIEAEKQRFEPAEYLGPAPELFSVRPFLT